MALLPGLRWLTLPPEFHVDMDPRQRVLFTSLITEHCHTLKTAGIYPLDGCGFYDTYGSTWRGPQNDIHPGKQVNGPLLARCSSSNAVCYVELQGTSRMACKSIL